ncbi:hypothetical protein QBC44DRAFT_71019 [Cladorrhinum sp. PSN332]|nr:hypothetical protein QBC44DRAFT_71019 [Cladorrhinum sp. PSN332]
MLGSLFFLSVYKLILCFACFLLFPSHAVLLMVVHGMHGVAKRYHTQEKDRGKGGLNSLSRFVLPFSLHLYHFFLDFFVFLGRHTLRTHMECTQTHTWSEIHHDPHFLFPYVV